MAVFMARDIFAERQRPGTPDRERDFDRGLRVVLPMIIELEADQGLSSAALLGNLVRSIQPRKFLEM